MITGSEADPAAGSPAGSAAGGHADEQANDPAGPAAYLAGLPIGEPLPFPADGTPAREILPWLIGRPEGMPQLRGSTLPLWMDVLPPLPAGVTAERARRVAAAMAADGGTARLRGVTCAR
ncbi:hypothetical protein [Kitasatospora sp. NPDC097691]|uniref:hypothetical protein n=1 Tax=Kitasatospora sp. NPDC097691 TaxID=3157231 RepID=UPI0033320C53